MIRHHQRPRSSCVTERARPDLRRAGLCVLGHAGVAAGNALLASGDIPECWPRRLSTERSTARRSSPVASADPVVSSRDKNPDEARTSPLRWRSSVRRRRAPRGSHASRPTLRRGTQQPCQEQRSTWPSPLGHEVADSPIERTSCLDPHASSLTRRAVRNSFVRGTFPNAGPDDVRLPRLSGSSPSCIATG